MSSRSLVTAAGLLWAAIGTLLVTRGVGMLTRAHEGGSGPLALSVASALGLFIGAAKGRFVLSKSALRNKARIQALERPRPWQLFRPGFYPLIGLMILLGIGLRSAAAAAARRCG